MPTSTTLPPTDFPLIKQKSAHPSIADWQAERTCGELVGMAHAALAAYQSQPADATRRTELALALRAAAATLNVLPRKSAGSAAVVAARDLVRAVAVDGFFDKATVEPCSSKAWPALLAHMLMVPAWLSPSAPPLDTVPDWLWGEYVAWLFVAPRIFTAVGQSDLFAAHFEGRVAELARWVERNPGSPAIRSAWDSYVASNGFNSLRLSASPLRIHAEHHGRMLARMTRIPQANTMAGALPLDGRRLRVGVITTALDDTAATLATIALFGHLDKERFEVEVFTLQITESAAERFARESAQALNLLPDTLSEQLSTLVGANLDVAIFAADLAGHTGEIARIALHRVAPLHVTTSAQATVSTGISSMDLFVTGTAASRGAEPEHFTERLGLIDGPLRSFNHDIRSESASIALDRSSVGLAADAAVYVSAANYREISADTQQSWARLLAATPGSFLVVQSLGENADGGEALAVEFDRVLASHQVAADRLVLAASPLASTADLKQLLQLGDVFLDPIPSGDDAAMIAALELGLPVVTLAGRTLRSRRGAALLQSIHHEELVAADEVAYSEIALRLIAGGVSRLELSARLKAAMESGPQVLDVLAASEAFGPLLEQAYNELASVGSKNFRANRDVIRVTASSADLLVSAGERLESGDPYSAAAQAKEFLRADPANAAARAILGKALLALGETVRAVDYLLAAVQSPAADAALWFDLSRALHASGRMQQALQTLETALRLNPGNVEAWRMLITVADDVGAHELAEEARTELCKYTPDSFSRVSSPFDVNG